MPGLLHVAPQTTMIIENQQDVTIAVLAEMQRTPDARTKEILASLVTHLHDFVRDVKLTEREFQTAIGLIAEDRKSVV